MDRRNVHYGMRLMLARADVQLLREWLPPRHPYVSSFGSEWTWMENVPAGPSTKGVPALERLQQKHGCMAVTTGNANPVTPGEIGLYVLTAAPAETGGLDA